jgi:hypothetical protein
MISPVVEAVGNKFVNIPGKMKKSKNKRQAVLFKVPTYCFHFIGPKINFEVTVAPV